MGDEIISTRVCIDLLLNTVSWIDTAFDDLMVAHQKVISGSQILSMKFSFNAKSGKVMGRTHRHVEDVQNIGTRHTKLSLFNNTNL